MALLFKGYLSKGKTTLINLCSLNASKTALELKMSNRQPNWDFWMAYWEETMQNSRPMTAGEWGLVSIIAGALVIALALMCNCVVQGVL